MPLFIFVDPRMIDQHIGRKGEPLETQACVPWDRESYTVTTEIWQSGFADVQRCTLDRGWRPTSATAARLMASSSWSAGCHPRVSVTPLLIRKRLPHLPERLSQKLGRISWKASRNPLGHTFSEVGGVQPSLIVSSSWWGRGWSPGELAGCRGAPTPRGRKAEKKSR